MDRRYKPLLPALPSNAPEPDRLPTDHQQPAPSKRKRVQVRIACDGCRAKKSACDGVRPTCSSCTRRGSPCTFGGRPSDNSDSSSSQTPLSSVESHRQSEAVELLNILTSAPYPQIASLLDGINSQPDYSSALTHLKTLKASQQQVGTTLLQPPEHGTIEFELMTRHGVLFPSDAALDSNMDSVSTYRQLQEPPLDANEVSSGDRDQKSPAGIRVDSSNNQSCEPPELSGFDETLLQDVDFKTWTTLSISNHEAAHAISRYLNVDHGILGLFDAALFLSDLTTGGTRFCSQLLVNALLSWATLKSKISTDAAMNWSSMFFEEASKILDKEKGLESVTVICALQLMSLTATYSGRGEQAQQLLRQAVLLGSQMGLLGNRESATEAPGTDDNSRAECQCAWGLFSYATLNALHRHKSELGRSQVPPYPLPPIIDTATTPLITRQDIYFPSFCRLWLLVHEVISQDYRAEADTALQQPTALLVPRMLHRLLDFGDALPLPLVRGNRITHHGLILHMMIHASILTLLRPLVLAQDESPLDFVSPADNPADEISSASINQLKRLVTMYLVHFSEDSPTVLWHTGCLYLANAMIRTSYSEEHPLTYFKYSLAGYKRLYPRYPVTKAIAKGLLAMAVSDHLITSQAANDVINQFRARETVSSPEKENTEVCFMVDLDLALTDQHSAHIDFLAQKFDDLVMFDEFTYNHIEGGAAVQ